MRLYMDFLHNDELERLIEDLGAKKIGPLSGPVEELNKRMDCLVQRKRFEQAYSLPDTTAELVTKKYPGCLAGVGYYHTDEGKRVEAFSNISSAAFRIYVQGDIFQLVRQYFALLPALKAVKTPFYPRGYERIAPQVNVLNRISYNEWY